MKVKDLVIVADLGEMKVYRAEPRDLEAEAGLKPERVKLDLIDARDYVASHWKLQDMVTDEAGQFKGGAQGRGRFSQGSVGERHELEKRVEEEIIRAIAEDIDALVQKYDPPKWFLGLPETVYDRVVERLNAKVRDKLFFGVKKDLVKSSKNDLLEVMKKRPA